MPTRGRGKGSRRKNRPRLRSIMGNFTFPRPTGTHSAPSCRAQSAQSRSQSGIPDGAASLTSRRSGGLHRLPDPVRREGRAVTSPTGGKRSHGGGHRSCFENTSSSSLPAVGTTRQTLKSARHGYGMCQFRLVISSAGPPVNAPYRPRIVRRGCELSQSRPASRVPKPTCPTVLMGPPPTLGMNRGILLARPVRERSVMPPPMPAHMAILVTGRETVCAQGEKTMEPTGGCKQVAGREAG